VQPVARQFRLHALIPIRDKLSLRIGHHLSNLGSCDGTRGAVAAFSCTQKVLMTHSTSNPRRAAQTRYRHRREQRQQIHGALGKDSPEPRGIQPPEMGSVVAQPQVGGLHHRYERRVA
jgi:hypothetical protein